MDVGEIYRNGLTKLSQGCEPQSGFNIVFIHGLRGHPQKTWEGQVEVQKIEGKARRSLFDSFRRTRSRAIKTDVTEVTPPKKVFWPQELLAQDIPEATIWTYGYNADVIGMFEANNQNSVYQHGRDLGIAIERDIDNEHPLIFVVHSLGGIVLKDALRRSEICQQRLRLIMFLGTPHRGSPAAGMGQIAARLASLALQDSNRDILRSLQTDNKVLNDIHEEFVKIVLQRNITIHSFQEAKGMTGLKGFSGKVVDNFSSKLDLPTVETVESIDADHRQMARCSRREDETYRKIAGELKSKIRNGILEDKPIAQLSSVSENSQQAAPETQYQERHIQMPFVPNIRFVGREEKLEELEKRLLINKTSQRLAIVGLGGIGKTQLARAFCYVLKERYPEFSIFWISAISSTTFKQDFRNIAHAYTLPDAPEAEQLLAIRDHLGGATAGKWLLIVDNADDTKLLRDREDGIAKYLPQSENGLILFTTRYKELADLADNNIMDIEEMSFSEASLFLEKFFQHDYLAQNEALVKEFLDELAYLPLAIVQATTYIIKNSITISKYLDLMRTTEEDVVKLLSMDFHDNTRSEGSHNAVAITWLVSFDQIKKDEPAAADLLFFLSFLENKAIPFSILPAFNSESELTQAVGALIGYSFLSRQGEGDTEVYDMHRLVHRAIGFWMQKENLVEKWKEKTVSHLAKRFPWSRWENRRVRQQYVPHAIRVLQHTEQTDKRAELCLKLGTSLDDDGRASEAIKWLSECVAWRIQTLPEDDPNLLIAQHNLGIAFWRNHQNEEAIEIFEKALATRQKLLEEDDYNLLSIQHTLAIVYDETGRTSEAIEILEKVVALKSRILADDDPSQLASRHALAQAYISIGQEQKAVDILEEVSAIGAKVFARDNPDQLASKHALAIAYQRSGRLPEAIKILEEVVAIEGEVRAEDDSSLLASRHVLAVVYADNYQLDKAISLMQHVVAIQQESLPVGHLDRVSSEAQLQRMREKRRVSELMTGGSIM